VDDEARQGALHFAETQEGPFLAPSGPARIPPLIELPRLLSAAEHILDDIESDEDLQLLLAPGSSLGGPGPKHRFGIGTGTWPLQSFQTKAMRLMPSRGKHSLSHWQKMRASGTALAKRNDCR
jgi:hypothetical protein